jgi:signal transduction histidine kinase
MQEIYYMFIIQSQSKDIQIVLKFDEMLPDFIESDARRYKQVIINLVSNALKFTMQGSITISLKFEEKTGMLIKSVKDTGVGISFTDRIQLFKLFGKLQSTSKMNKTGIGLGLNICKQIVNVFNGEIMCESQEDKGTTFTFTWKVQDSTYLNTMVKPGQKRI